MRSKKVFDGQRSLIASIFVASAFVNVLILTAPLYMLQLFSRVMTSGSISTLMALTLAAAIAIFFYFAFDAIRQRLSSRLGVRLEESLGASVLGGLVDDVPMGEKLGSQPMRDIQDLRNFVSGPAFTALLDAPWALLFVAVIFFIHPVLGIISLAGIALLFLLGVISEMSGRAPNNASSEATRAANRTADELLRNAEIVRAMGKTSSMVDRWRAQSLSSMVFGTLASDRVALMGSLAKAVRMSLQIALLGSGVVLLLNNELTAGLMMASAILLGRAASPVEQSINGWRSFMSVRISIARLNMVLARQEVLQDLMELPEPEGHLSVEDVTVVLPDRQDPAVFGVSFDLKPGMSLGIIGPSGAGKTTLARALVGLQPLARGYVRIDDAALTDWPTSQIGRYIGFLPQRVELFKGTVAENIAMMDEQAAPADIVDAAKRAEVHDLILGLPKGYNTPVGVMGERLSAGQRQRIGLARAFFGDRRLIVLDEPNANLDPEGEEALSRAVANATARGAVVVVVTHRMSILRRVSHAAVMEAGRIVRFGGARDVLEAVIRPAAQQVGSDEKIAVLRARKPLQTAAIQRGARK